MILERGNMLDMWGKTDLFLFTSNPIVNKQGLAVMGRGIAKQIADKYPQVQKEFGQYLAFPGPDFNCDRLCVVDDQLVGFFMVKDHWRSPARLDIISDSVDELIHMAEVYERIDLNFPGIGNGKLARDYVLPVIQDLPNNVHVWEYDQ